MHRFDGRKTAGDRLQMNMLYDIYLKHVGELQFEIEEKIRPLIVENERYLNRDFFLGKDKIFGEILNSHSFYRCMSKEDQHEYIIRVIDKEFFGIFKDLECCHDSPALDWLCSKTETPLWLWQTGFVKFALEYSGLYWDRELHLYSFNISSLPSHLKIDGDLDLSQCWSIASLSDIDVKGSLILNECMKLRSIKTGLKVGGDLSLINCILLTSLPENMKVENDVTFGFNNRFLSLPRNMEVGGLRCRHSNINHLPENSKIYGDVDFSNCTNLKSIGRNVSIDGSLNLDGCQSLRWIGENLSVGKTLSVKGCTALKNLPENLKTKNKIVTKLKIGNKFIK
jgi:hypothetical protein